MLQYPATSLILAIIAGIIGFGSIAGFVAEIAQILCFLFLGIFLLSLVVSRTSRRD